MLERDRGVLIAGVAGVGKTRLARDVMERVETSASPIIRVSVHRPGSTPLSSLEGAISTVPTVVVDDIHLLDDDSAALLHSMVAAETIRLLATLRTGEPLAPAIRALWKDDVVERIDLENLARAEVDELLDLALDAPIDAPTRLALWEASAGSPLMIREFVRSSLDHGDLRLDAGVWRLHGEPRSVRLDELLTERLDALSDSARDAVELVALAGAVGLEALVEIVGHAPVIEAEDAGLLVVAPDGLRRTVQLVHPLYGDIARRSLASARAARAYSRLLAQLESTPLRRDDDIVSAATWQLRAGGKRVSSDMVLAARRALYGNQQRLAIELATKALDDSSVDAALVVSEALAYLGEAERAYEIVRDLRADHSEQSIALVAVQRAIALFWGLGDAQEAEAALLDAEDVLPPGAWRDEVTAERALFWGLAGRHDAAREVALPFLSDETNVRAFLTSSITIACSDAICGRCDDAIAVATRAFEIASELGEQPTMADPGTHFVALTTALSEAGRITEATPLAELGYSESVTAGKRMGQAWFSMMLGRSRMITGRLEAARSLFVESAGSFNAMHSAGPRRWALAGVVISAAGRDDLEGADAGWQELVAAGPHPAVLWGAQAGRAEAWLAAVSGDRPAAIDLLRRVAAASREEGTISFTAEALHDVVRLGGSVADSEWDEFVDVQGELAPLRAEFGRAVNARDGRLVDAAAAKFTELGADIFAAEASLIAAELHTAVSDSRAAARSRRAAAHSQQLTGEEWLLTLDRAAPPVALTGREREIADLASLGRSNREIAEACHLSVRTVENHLQRIYDKLGVNSRRELTSSLIGIS